MISNRVQSDKENLWQIVQHTEFDEKSFQRCWKGKRIKQGSKETQKNEQQQEASNTPRTEGTKGSVTKPRNHNCLAPVRVGTCGTQDYREYMATAKGSLDTER